MNKLYDIRFGKLIAKVPLKIKYAKKLVWLCDCDCGTKQVKVTANNLLKQTTKSCGCLRKTNSGLTFKEAKTYKAWSHMLSRCYDTRARSYTSHGGRGIIVCDRWRYSFGNFIEDMGRSPEKMQLDRIDNDGNYEPSNCRWVTAKENCNNKRTNRYLTIKGRTQTIQQWSEEYGISAKLVRQRINRDKRDPKLALIR